MGQRLVLSVFEDGERLCNIYYHWAAYTSSAFYAIHDIVNILNGIPISHYDVKYIQEDDGNIIVNRENIITSKDFEIEDPVLRIATALEPFGGGFSREDREEVEKKYGKEAPFASDRNAGLICISEAQMEDSDNWAEGEAVVDISNKTCRNDCFFIYHSVKEYMEDFECTHVDKVECPYNLDEIHFEDLEACMKWFVDTETLDGDKLISCGSYLYSVIC